MPGLQAEVVSTEGGARQGNSLAGALWRAMAAWDTPCTLAVGTAQQVAFSGSAQASVARRLVCARTLHGLAGLLAQPPLRRQH